MERKKNFHINMLKQYLEREDDQEVQSNDESQVCAVSLVDLTAKEMEDKCSDGLIMSSPMLNQEKEHK